MAIPTQLIEEVAYELNRRAAIAVPLDARQAFTRAAERETNGPARNALLSIVQNAGIAVEQQTSSA
jgi:tartrate dehydratase alpha subunit/fumarate hydratase class I-like protein